MRRFRVPALLLALCAVSASLIASSDSRHVIVISIDGMRPGSYTSEGAAKLPTLRALMARGAHARGVVGVLPTVTYPSHTTLITGVPPAVHGIVNNTVLDPESKANGAWYWYARQIKVPTLPGVVRAKGLTAAAVSWPVTVGMDLDYDVPEHNRSRHPEGLNLLRALSTPRGIVDAYEGGAPQPITWPMTDADRTGMAAWMVKTFRPDLLLLHIFDNDTASHDFGPDSPEARAALEQSDAHVATMLDAVKQAGIADRTNVVIVSDHGFLPIETQLQPNYLFKREGLIEVNDRGLITTWQAYLQSSGGAGFVFLKDRADAALATRVKGLLDTIAADPANGVEKVWTADDLARVGAYPEASFALTMKPGFYMGAGHTTLRQPTTGKGGHGFDPSSPALHASLILAGPDVVRKGDLGIVQMTQIAPTIARWFGVQLAPDADKPLW